MKFASKTGVSVDRTKGEIERMLGRYGCTQFQSGWDTDHQTAHVGFRFQNTMVMVGLTMPRADEFQYSVTGRRRPVHVAESVYAQEIRRRWRSLLLIIKAKLEAVDCGLTTIEREFLADIVLPNGRTLGEWAVPQIAEITTGRLALPEHREGR